MTLFNAKARSKRKNNIVGKFGEEIITNNAIQLIGICDAYRLRIRIRNGFFENKFIHK